MQRSYELVIPSRERAAWLATHAKSTLQYVAHLAPRFMVRDDDTQLKAYHAYAARYGLKCEVYDGSGIYGAAQTYDKIIDEAIAAGHERLLILDDDLQFKMRNPINGARPMYKACKPTELSELFEHITTLVRPEVPIMSFTPIMTRSQPNIIALAKPMMMAYAFYLPHFKSHPEHRFWVGKQIEARCDLNLTLRLLTEGFLTAFMVTCFIPDNVNNPGGCSTYRFLDVERASIAYLCEHYGQFIQLRKKRGWMGDMSIVRDAPVIAWQAAFNRSAFKERFNYASMQAFVKPYMKTYEERYAQFISALREAYIK